MSEESTGFDYLTMQNEWRDHLEVACAYPVASPEMIAELGGQHATLFKHLLAKIDIEWDSVEGTFHLNEWGAEAYLAGVIQMPSPEQIDKAWFESFGTVAANIKYTEEMMADLASRQQ